MNNSYIQKLLLFFCLYIPFQLAINPLPGVDLSSGRIIVPLLFAAWLLRGLKKKKINLPFSLPTLLLFSFLFLNAFSLFYAQNAAWSLRKLFFLLSFFPLYLLVADFAADPKGGRKIIRALSWGAGLAAGIGIIQFFLPFIFGLDATLRFWATLITPFLGTAFSQAVLQNSSWLVNLSGVTVFRAIAFFPDPHMFSFYLNMLLPWTLALSFSKTNQPKIFLLISFLLLAASFLTFSRGGYMGLLAGTFFALFFFRHAFTAKIKKGLLAVALLFILIVFAPNPISQRFFSSFNFFEGSNQGRLETWQQSLAVIRQNPVLGTGLGNYSLAIKPSATYREPIYSHNLYLDIAAETGVVNALIFILLLLYAIISFIQKARADRFHFAGALSLIIFSVHSLFETPLFSVHILPLLIIILALNNPARTQH